MAITARSRRRSSTIWASLGSNILFRKVHDDVRSRTNGQQEPFTYGSLSAESMYFKAAGP